MSKSCAIRDPSDAPKCLPHLAPELPDDLMHVIFSKLHHREKVNAGQVCKSWDRLLKDGSAEGKHWGFVCCNVDRGLPSQASTTREKLLEHFETGIGRCVTVLTFIFPEQFETRIGGCFTVLPLIFLEQLESCFGRCVTVLTSLGAVLDQHRKVCHCAYPFSP